MNTSQGSPPINHAEAKQLAEMKQESSNLARCYLALRADKDRLDGVLAHGFIRWIADGPYKGLLLMDRAAIDRAIATLNSSS